MEIWLFWWNIVRTLRPAFKRERTFLWFITALAGMIVRQDQAGVTSFVRSLGIAGCYYDRLLDLFHSNGIDRLTLKRLWTKAVFALQIGYSFNGKNVIIADGVKAPKEGKKMPAVKSLHQESSSNSKAEFIMGHSCQVVALLCHACSSFFAIPLAAEIHEGLVFSNRDCRTTIDKLNVLMESLNMPNHFYLIADAFYACVKVAKVLIENGNHLISRVRSNAIAYYPAKQSKRKKAGRPKKYGRKVKLKKLFDEDCEFVTSASPIAGEKDKSLQYRVIDLIWRPLSKMVRFVLVIHPIHGKTIFISTDLSLSALQIIELYSLRFKIELSFKQAIHAIGTYAYHFWMKSMKPIRRGSGNQYLHKESSKYRSDIKRKMGAYDLYLQVGVIAQGILQCLSAIKSDEVWASFRSWLRTIRPGIAPSEQVTALAMSNTLSEFLADSHNANTWKKFLLEKSDSHRWQWSRAGND